MRKLLKCEIGMVDPHKPDYSNTPVNPNRPRYHYQLVELSLKPIVSIVTPFYNTGPIFQETAFSILQQSLQQFEWIIVNDGSYEAESLTILEHSEAWIPGLRSLTNHPTWGCRRQGTPVFTKPSANTSYLLTVMTCLSQLRLKNGSGS